MSGSRIVRANTYSDLLKCWSLMIEGEQHLHVMFSALLSKWRDVDGVIIASSSVRVCVFVCVMLQGFQRCVHLCINVCICFCAAMCTYWRAEQSMNIHLTGVHGLGITLQPKQPQLHFWKGAQDLNVSSAEAATFNTALCNIIAALE